MKSALLFFFIWLFPIVSPDSKVEWVSPTTHDFGDLKLGETVATKFLFKNLSETPMSIDNVRTTCGCTAADWQEEVVPPGGDGSIQIEFEAQKTGYFSKKITVWFSGRRKGEKLFIEGYVE